MVVLRPGNDDFNPAYISFGPLTKNDSGYCAEILYNQEPLYYQFNDCLIEHGSSNDVYLVKNLSKDYESVEQAIRARLVQESHHMFKRGFTEEMLIKMQKHLCWTDEEYLQAPTYTKNGIKGTFVAGEGDVIFQCCCVVFEQSSWRLVWTLVQIRQDQEIEIRADPNYLFVDDPDEEEDQVVHHYEDGYESDNEQTEDNFTFVPNPDNE